MVSQLALGAIWGYQRFLSPYKGFRCAHSVLHGGTGCSGHAKHTIRDQGFWAALPAIRQRSRDCRDAARVLQANCAAHGHRNQAPDDAPDDGSDQDARARTKLKRHGCRDMACDGGYCGFALPAFFAAGGAGANGATSDKLGTPVDGAGGGADGCSALECPVPSCSCDACNCFPSCS